MKRIKIKLTEHKLVVGSRRVVKSVDLSAEEGKAHYYGDGDLWTRYADQHKIADKIPKDHIVYGELVGFTGPGSPIQKGYTYDLDDGEAALYVYRVSVVTSEGRTVDYSPAQMATFCEERGLLAVPVLASMTHYVLDAEGWLERRYYDEWANPDPDEGMNFDERPVPLSGKGVDEGVCIRYDGPHGTYILKAKSPTFVRGESAALDAGVEDIEADEAVAA